MENSDAAQGLSRRKRAMPDRLGGQITYAHWWLGFLGMPGKRNSHGVATPFRYDQFIKWQQWEMTLATA